jgi:hypothetical protein
MRSVILALFASLALANSVAAQDLSASENRALIEWVSQRNSVQQRMVVVALRIRSTMSELTSTFQSDVDLDEWRGEIDRSLESLNSARDDIDSAVRALPPPPVFDGREEMNARLDASFSGVMSLHSRSSELLTRALGRLETLRASGEITVSGLATLDVDVQIAMLDAVIAQKEGVRSSDLSNPATLENIASTALNRVNRDLLEIFRMLLVSERSTELEDDLLFRIESDAEEVRANLEPIRQAAMAQLDELDTGLAAEGPEAISRFSDLRDRLAVVLETYTAVTGYYSELDAAVANFLSAYRAGNDQPSRLQAASELSEAINRIVVRSNEIQANRMQLSTEFARAYEAL